MAADEQPNDSGQLESTLLGGDAADEDRVDSRESWLAELASAPAFAPGPKPGDCLGDEYVIERKLGEGAMGVVYLAHHPRLDRKVAIKLHSAQSERAASRLLDEARAVAQIQHENVLVVHAVGTWNKQVFLAMEFVDGPTARQWVKAEPRGWREIVALYVEAGRGLAAAHARGVIHRDFKPDNVLVPRAATGRGRVKVADFGLARRAAEQSSSSGPTSPRNAAADGGLAGSPAYMAPEQYERSDVDARADQFAFCVSLFEALCGRRPFEGDTLSALAASIASGRFRDPDSDAVPRHVRRALRRGLSPLPEARFPDMPALLAALARDPTINRRRALGALVAVGLGASVTWAATRRVDPLPACVAAPDVAAWWTAASASDLHAALRTSGREHADNTFARVDSVLRSYRDEAAVLLQDSCRAAHVEGTRSRMDLEAQRECLVQRGREVTTLVEVLGEGTSEIADRAVAAVEGLEPVARCADPRGLEPADDGTDPAIADARQRLAVVKSMGHAGRFDDAAKAGRDALPDFRALGRPRLLAELLLVIAIAEVGAHRHASAGEALREAVGAATLAGADALAADIAAQGVFVDGYLGRSQLQGEQWSVLGWAWLERAGWPEDLVREMLGQRGLARRTADRYAEAVLDLSLALALSQGEDDSALRGGLLAALGETYRRMGRYDLARSTAQQAVDSYVEALGERHPYAINALNLVAGVDLESGRFAEAEATLRRAIELGEAVLGPQSRRLIDPRVNLATVLVNTGRIEEGIAIRQQAYDLVTAPGAPRNEARVTIIANLATDVAMNGQSMRARVLQREAVDLAREIAGTQSALYARQLTTAADLELDSDPVAALAKSREAEEILARVAPGGFERVLARGTTALAFAQLDRCDEVSASLPTTLAETEAAVGKEHPALSTLIAAQGHCEAVAGRHDAALVLLDRAARLHATVMDPFPMVLEWQARAHLGRGDEARAREVLAQLVKQEKPDEPNRTARNAALAADIERVVTRAASR